jgi:hypothetical protein
VNLEKSSTILSIQYSKKSVSIIYILSMSEFAFFRFMTYNMLTIEEQQHKDEIVSLTEEVLDARGIECDSKISKISEEQLREILEQVRKLRKKKKKEQDNTKYTQDQLDLAVQ